MEIPIKYYYDFDNNQQVDANGQRVVQTGEMLQAVLGTKPLINIQLLDGDGANYTGMEATATAQMLVDSDFVNAPVPIPMGADAWTNTAGNEYSKPLTITPVTVYFAGTLKSEGTAGSLSAGEWDYDTSTLLLHVRLDDDTEPGTVSLTAAGWTNTVGSEYKKSVAFAPDAAKFNSVTATENDGGAGSLSAGEWDYDTGASELHVRLFDSTNPTSKASGWVTADHADDHVTLKMSVSNPTTPFIECYASDVNQANTWWDTGTSAFRNPDIEAGELSFRLNANTAYYYIRIGTSEKASAVAEIQFFNAADDLIAIKKMDFTCWNRIYGSATTPLDIAPSNYYTKTETDRLVYGADGYSGQLRGGCWLLCESQRCRQCSGVWRRRYILTSRRFAGHDGQLGHRKLHTHGQRPNYRRHVHRRYYLHRLRQLHGRGQYRRCGH